MILSLAPFLLQRDVWASYKVLSEQVRGSSYAYPGRSADKESILSVAPFLRPGGVRASRNVLSKHVRQMLVFALSLPA